MRKISFKYKGKTFSFSAKELGAFGKVKGLMFSSKNKAIPLLFNFRKPTRISIHSFFVFFPFVAVWLNSENKVVDLRTVKPFTFHVSPKRKFSKLIEIPISDKYNLNKLFPRR